MRRLRWHAAWWALWCLAAPAAQAQGSAPRLAAETVAERLRDQALADPTAFRIVESLTTEIGARPAGSAADARSVAWAVAKLQSLGYDKVTTEPVTLRAWRRIAESAAVTAPVSQRLAVTALGGSVGTGGPLQAEVVRLLDQRALQDAAPAQLRGKIVLLTRRMERRGDGSGYADVLPMRSDAASIAAGKGALALLIRSLGTDHNRLPHTGSVIYAGDAAIPAAAVSGPDADLLERLIERNATVRVSLDIQVSTATATSFNVIGEITGSAPRPEVVMLAAHLDSWDLGTGAIDDGFGVGLVMATGALIKRSGMAPRHTVRVVLFANEENGFDGAKNYAARDPADLRRHRIALESDWGAGRIYALRHPPADAFLSERMARVLGPLGITLEPAAAGTPGPDLQFLARAGLPWTQLAQDATELFDHHHSANDTLDKIDPAALRQNTAAYVVFTWLMANTE